MLLVTSSPFSFSSDGLDASSLIHFASKANKTEEKFICFANHEGQTGAADALFMGLAKVSLINCCHDKFYSGRSQDGNGTFLFSLWQIMSQVRLHTLLVLLQSYIHQKLHFANNLQKLWCLHEQGRDEGSQLRRHNMSIFCCKSIKVYDQLKFFIDFLMLQNPLNKRDNLLSLLSS